MEISEFSSKKVDKGELFEVIEGDVAYIQPKDPKNKAYPLPNGMEAISFWEVSPRGKFLRIGNIKVT